MSVSFLPMMLLSYSYGSVDHVLALNTLKATSGWTCRYPSYSHVRVFSYIFRFASYNHSPVFSFNILTVLQS